MKGNGKSEDTAAESGVSSRGDPKRVADYIKAVIIGDPLAKVESVLFRYSLGTIMAFIVLLTLVYAAGFSLPGPPAYLPFILIGFASSVIVCASYMHVESYKQKMCCVNGMMVGMTSGMACGFLAGALIGATNGMFIGSAAGSLAGIVVGSMAGRFSGVMGAMEGIMAGLMSGTMGAMLSVMMINDNLMAFIVLLFGVCFIILASLSYMMHREAGPTPRNDGLGFLGFFALCAVFGILAALLMLFGPKGPITAV